MDDDLCVLFLQSWDEFFSRATQGAPPGQAYDAPPTLRPGGVTEDPNLIKDHLAVQALIRAYQIRGKMNNLSVVPQTQNVL